MKSITIAAALMAVVAVIGVVAVTDCGDEVSATNVTTEAGLEQIFTSGGEAVLTEDIDLTKELTVGSGVTATLDLNGHTIRGNFSGKDSQEAMISVSGTLSVSDSGSEGTGQMYTDTYLGIFTVESTGTLTIDSGNFIREGSHDHNVVMQFGDLTINGGYFEMSGVNTDVSPTLISTRPEGNTTVNNGTFVSDVYAFAVFGTGENPVENESTTLTIRNATVTADTAISTNASNGDYAGLTINVSGGTFNSDIGIYAPGYGIYNISGGHFTSTQSGIQAFSGIISISGDVVIETTGTSDGTYGQLGTGSGPGSIVGGIVVGKPNEYYVGNIQINITGGTVRSTTDGDAIVVCDNSLNKEQLASYSVSISATGGDIEGNVVFTTAESSDGDDSTEAGQNTNPDKITFVMNGSSVDGDITADEDYNKIIIESGTVTGDVPGTVIKPSATGTVTYPDGTSTTYYDSFRMPAAPADREGYTFLGYSLTPDATSAPYQPGQSVTGISGNVTVYEVWESDAPVIFPWIDDDEYVPPIYNEPQDSGDDDTVTIVACAAAAVVAALLAVFLVIERRNN